MQVGEALRHGTERLMNGGSGSPRLDAALLLAHTLQTPREALITHPERSISENQARTFESLLVLRARGMPIAYLLGSRPFWDRTFRVTSHVLIPRPETEKLVEVALQWARKQPGSLRILDVGTGSGVIAVTLAAQLPDAQVIATDVSLAALRVAQENADGLPNLTLIQADLLEPFAGRFDLIASNLPYIASEELSILDVAKFEPLVALDGGADGLRLIERLLAQTPAYLTSPGLLLLEHGADQGPAVAALAQIAFPNAQVQIVKDDAGLDRLVRIALD